MHEKSLHVAYIYAIIDIYMPKLRLTPLHKNADSARRQRSIQGFLVALLIFGCAGNAALAEKPIPLCLQLHWFPQAEFAGYYVAQRLGFYREEGLDITVLSGGSVNAVTNVAIGNCDIGIDFLTSVLIRREVGISVKVVSQILQKSGYRMASLKSAGIERPEDFAGKTIGVWGYGGEYLAETIFTKLGLSSDLDPTQTTPDVNTVIYAFDPALVFPDEVDVVSVMTYNELNQVIALGYPLEDLNVFDPNDVEAGLVEDVVFTTEKLLGAKSFNDSGLSGEQVVARFLRATVKGWKYAIENQPETLEIILDECGDTCSGSGSQSPLAHQTWQLRRIAELVRPTHATQIGKPDLDRIARTARLLVDTAILKVVPDLEDIVYQMPIFRSKGIRGQ